MLELFSPEQGFEGNTLEEAHCTSVTSLLLWFMYMCIRGRYMFG